MKLIKAEVRHPGDPIVDAISDKPILVVADGHEDQLVGLLTASDVL